MARTIQKSSPLPDSNVYSLWLMPRGPIYRRLSRAITQLSQACETPRFEPHLTLLGGISGAEEVVISQTVKLADALEPINLKLTAMSTTDDYFRCLYFQVEPTDDLLKAHQQAREILNRKDEPPFIPHFSLMYGSYPEEGKKAIIAKLEDVLRGEFVSDQLYLYNTSGIPDRWLRIRAYKLA